MNAIVFISHASKVILKILQAKLQQYMNWELPDVQTEFRKGRGTRGQIANIFMTIEKAKEFQKNLYICFTDYTKVFDLVQFSSVTQSCQTLCDPMNHSKPGLPVHQNSQSSPKPMSIESVMPSNHLILCYPPLLLPSNFPASGSLQMSQFFAWGGQSIGVSASTSAFQWPRTDLL